MLFFLPNILFRNSLYFLPIMLIRQPIILILLPDYSHKFIKKKSVNVLL